MTLSITTSSSTFSAVKVNVKLCGSVPRDDMTLLNCAPHMLQSPSSNRSCLEQQPSLPRRTTKQLQDSSNSIEQDNGDHVAAEICLQLSSLQQRPQQFVMPEQRTLSTTTYEAPGWAVPAFGEARLEPVCDSVNRQPPIDLTERPVFRIGRSPQSDVQLIHATSSRKHAMMFHHKNGSCYIIDCNSAHGTFLNGVRLSSLPNGGVVVPHKVRRGSIVRFGGPGAPSYMLKSFSFGLQEMRDYPVNNPNLSPTSAVNAEVQHNTRFNALGTTAKNSLMTILTSKRSFDSMSTVDDADFDCKRQRCTSPPLSPQQVPLNLVSPDFSQPGHKRRRVSFSSAPPTAFYPSLVSPDLSSDENDCEETI